MVEKTPEMKVLMKSGEVSIRGSEDMAMFEEKPGSLPRFRSGRF